jgi:hypothetical protein
MGTEAAYGACSIKRPRRTKSDMDSIRLAIYETLRDDHPMTQRQLFYRLVSQGVIDKTEAQYQTTVIRLTNEMRLSGAMDAGWIADNTRWMRKPNTHSSLQNALRETARTYRRSVWDEQDVYVEVWLEKDALAGVLVDVTAAWDVPLMVTKGFASLSFLYGAAETIRDRDKPTFLYYFGDHDPSGVDIPRQVERRLREFAPNADITFKRIAVNPDQIERWKLPTRPTKKTDSRSKNFEGDSVEVDAIPSRDLRQLATDCIVGHIDPHVYANLQKVERSERETLRTFMEAWNQGEIRNPAADTGSRFSCSLERGRAVCDIVDHFDEATRKALAISLIGTINVESCVYEEPELMNVFNRLTTPFKIGQKVRWTASRQVDHKAKNGFIMNVYPFSCAIGSVLHVAWEDGKNEILEIYDGSRDKVEIIPSDPDVSQ